MERLREICKCLKTLVDFLLYHCDRLPKHDPKPWDPPFDLSQPKLDPPLAVAITITATIFLFIVTALSSHYQHAIVDQFRRIWANPRNSTLSGQIAGMSPEKCLVEDGGILHSQKRDIWTLQEFLGGYKEGGLNQAAINFYLFEQGRIVAYKLFEMISCSNSSLNQDGSTLATMQGNIEFRNVYFIYFSHPEILILSGFYQNFRLDLLMQVKFYWMGRYKTSEVGMIEEAAKTIHAHDFITSLEMGYETQVGRIGLTLTEEQKIKISIARVVLSNPSILLLDEVTSGLDFEAEKVVQEALDILMLGRSTIIIARRLSLILLYI
ncbi:hypothetical protein ZIOFF_024848 [Zingiber officinale]|uniref:ABC transporter domain-containing protein n=1 Tax=Zingiber officinale TaxID=94328 RepID=A0A8J5LJ99_ZINOF|nr:hypothetical protein ZIOFF_024848 [Zingiber officinale]